jgi:hypothetical protein
MELPSESATLELVGHYGRLRARLHSELGQVKLVLPTNEHFPDRFDRSQAAAARLVHRMQLHAHIEDIPVRVAIEDAEAATGGSCSSGGCGTTPGDSKARLELDADGWALQLSAAELSHPVSLTGAVARSLGAIFLEETREDSTPLPQPIELYSELSAVMLGFGVLLLESSHLYTKACSGPRITQLTLLSPSELAVLTALFAAEHQLKLKPAIKASSPTQRALLAQAHDLVRANPRLLEWVGRAGVSESSPSFALNEAKPSLFGGMFEKLSQLRGKPVEETDLEAWINGSELDAKLLDAAALPSQRALPPSPRAPAAHKPDDELKALVAEALDAHAAGR